MKGKNTLPTLAWQGGRVMPADKLRIDPRDIGLLRGYAFFDVLPAVGGVPLFWERHFIRLQHSAQALHLTLPVSKKKFHTALVELIASFPGNCTLRTVCTGGPSSDGFTPVPGRETFYILAEPHHPIPATVYRQGVKLITEEYARALPKVKFPNHALAIQLLPRRLREGAFDLLYVQNGIISEAAQGNILVVSGSTLTTFAEATLPGIVRQIVLEQARERGMRVINRALTLAETCAADEVLLTGSSKGIVPVVQIDDAVIAQGHPGMRYAELSVAYTAAAVAYAREYSNWTKQGKK